MIITYLAQKIKATKRARGEGGQNLKKGGE